MITCGLKLTHDGSVALLDDNKLIFNVEVEKLENNPRYSPLPDLELVPRILGDFGYQVSDIDHWGVDGWDGHSGGEARLHNRGEPLTVPVAAYREGHAVPDLLRPGYTGDLPLGRDVVAYESYAHLAGHLASAYCSSPFARALEPAIALVWDGGTFPRIYFVDPTGGVENGGSLFPLIGHAYATVAHHFGPFKRERDAETVDDLSVAGKLMAYIALGTVQPEIVRTIGNTYHDHFEASNERVLMFRRMIGGWGSNSEPSLRYLHAFYRDLASRLALSGAADEDVLASMHAFLESLLVQRLEARLKEWRGDGPWNLCFVGGCALNIKWNSALRSSGLFRSVWVPPFPNDSGSAIGVASLHRGKVSHEGLVALDWNVRSGPQLLATQVVDDGWSVNRCSIKGLARHLHEAGGPIVLLQGKAEVGPRALGGRSIVAAATRPDMKELLNRVKDRENYRPVAPICLEEVAPEVFDPGTPDPYMLFDHKVRPGWVERIPAVLHLDGTARLETVNEGDDPILEALLREYYRLSGIPVLCNTSANYQGRGFFPDVASAIAWGRVPNIWSDGYLYSRGGQLAGGWDSQLAV